MSVHILTIEDLLRFQSDLIEELKVLFKKESQPVKKWLKSEEVKRMLKVSSGTLQTLRINRTLQYTKIGGIIFYDYEHIEKVMKENLRPGGKT